MSNTNIELVFIPEEKKKKILLGRFSRVTYQDIMEVGPADGVKLNIAA